MPARSIVDAAQWAGTDAEARAIVAAGFQQRIVRGEDLREVLDRMPRLRRRKLILGVATDAAGGAHSLAELDFLGLVRRAGLPEPIRQMIRRDASGRRRYLDAYFEEWRVHVEIDGGQHLDPRAAWADMRRQNDLWVEGDRVLRFPSWALRAHPAEVIAQLRAALRRAGWPG
ncbi:endonuclease domain-containing protein [Micromonospora sp. NPDC047730]|uniref:endonuclease domain-containing protein n=1 Tax=Micromonospora sp. NPDC047730 TaxID=3364253 RepID=UPI00371AA6C0